MLTVLLEEPVDRIVSVGQRRGPCRIPWRRALRTRFILRCLRSHSPCGRWNSPSGRGALQWLRYNDTFSCVAGSPPDRSSICISDHVGTARRSPMFHPTRRRLHQVADPQEWSTQPDEFDHRVVTIAGVRTITSSSAIGRICAGEHTDARRSDPSSASGRGESGAGHPWAEAATDRALGSGSR